MSAEQSAGNQGAEKEPKQPAGLTSEQAEILLRADLRNLALKVQQGKTLSSSERNLLQSVLGGGKASAEGFAANQVELAEILGVSRKAIQRGRKRDGNPGVRPDGRWDVNAWREFLRQTGRCIKDEPEEESSDLSHTHQRVRNILLKNEKLEAELAILRKQWVPAGDVERWGGELGSAIRKVVGTIHLAAPTVVGVSVAEAEARLKELEDEILQQLHLLDEAIAEWKERIEPAA